MPILRKAVQNLQDAVAYFAQPTNHLAPFDPAHVKAIPFDTFIYQPTGEIIRKGHVYLAFEKSL